VSDPDIGGGEPSGLRFMLHAFYCKECPPVPHASAILWTTNTDGRRLCPDYRDADSAVAPSRVGVSLVPLCSEGFELARQARARGWGS
jgi:hypothetical protein